MYTVWRERRCSGDNKTCGMSKWNGIARARGSFGENGVASGYEVSDKDNIEDNGIE